MDRRVPFHRAIWFNLVLAPERRGDKYLHPRQSPRRARETRSPGRCDRRARPPAPAGRKDHTYGLASPMGTTLSVILVIALVLAAGLLRDSLRTGAVQRWCRTHGFGRVPTPEHDRERLIAWAERFRPDTASHWSIVLRGETAGVETNHCPAVYPVGQGKWAVHSLRRRLGGCP